jgi:2-polyprenyl-3-methyl-5-hydroxy-6-metoxy-1,4-benzoquinol methylase
MKDIYNDQTYLRNNPTWHEEDAPFKKARILKLLRRNSLPLGTICDVGCGSGEILVQLAAQLPATTQFTGVDISQDAIAIASRKQTERIQFALHDLTQPSTSPPYDLLLVIDVIEHLNNYFEFLAGTPSFIFPWI